MEWMYQKTIMHIWVLLVSLPLVLIKIHRNMEKMVGFEGIIIMKYSAGETLEGLFSVLLSWHRLALVSYTLRRWNPCRWRVSCSSQWWIHMMGTGSKLWNTCPSSSWSKLCAPRFCRHHCSMPTHSHWIFEVGKIHVVKRLYSEDIMTKNKILFMAYSNASVIDLLMQAFQPVHSGWKAKY